MHALDVRPPGLPASRRGWGRWAAGLGLALLFAVVAHAQQASLEYKVKAAFLFNFAKYVEWPAHAFESDQAPIILGVLGEDPFGDVLEKTVQNRSVNNRSVVIRRASSPDLLKNCHVIFIGNSERNRLADVMSSLQSSFALTVGEGERFFQVGGMVRFAIVEGSVRFEIHRDNAERAGLKIGSRMLTSARTVVSSRAPPNP